MGRSRRDLDAGFCDKIRRVFAVLLPVRTVGVMGDGSTCDITSTPPGMTDWV
jgi:GMP synthase PP-ATPase subunit